MSKTIKLTESEFKTFIKETIINVISNINEAENPALERGNATEGTKKIWDIIDKKQKGN